MFKLGVCFLFVCLLFVCLFVCLFVSCCCCFVCFVGLVCLLLFFLGGSWLVRVLGEVFFVFFIFFILYMCYIVSNTLLLLFVSKRIPNGTLNFYSFSKRQENIDKKVFHKIKLFLL